MQTFNQILYPGDLRKLKKVSGKIHLDNCNMIGVTSGSLYYILNAGTQYKKPSAYRERAPWEKPEEGEGNGFDEKEFLMGRVPLVGSKDNATQSELVIYRLTPLAAISQTPLTACLLSRIPL